MPVKTSETDRLRRLYVDEQMTISQVAASLGVAPQTVHNRLVAAQIPRRPSPSTPRSDVTGDEGPLPRFPYPQCSDLEKGLLPAQTARRHRAWVRRGDGDGTRPLPT